jgi:ribonuclease BN (tRNA processing enzyme)
MSETLFRIHGARGSHPVFGPSVTKYGGHTTCFSLETDRLLLIFDAGSGISQINKIIAETATKKKVSLFFTHFHLDHLLGLMGLKMLYEPDSALDICGASPRPGDTPQKILSELFSPRLWPVPLASMAADFRYHEIDSHGGQMALEDVTIHWHAIPHTQLCLSYQLGMPGGSITIATDHEPSPENVDSFIEFTKGADLLVQDAQYTPAEYETRKGWGHGTWVDAAHIANNADVGKLVLTHHDPEHSDEDLDDILRQTRAEFALTSLAKDGLAFRFNSSTVQLETAILN